MDAAGFDVVLPLLPHLVPVVIVAGVCHMIA